MKKILYLAFVAIAVLAMNACKSNSEPTPPDEPKQDTTKVESIKGSITTPAWTNPEGYDMTSSMTAIVKVDLAQSFSADQLVEGGRSRTDGWPVLPLYHGSQERQSGSDTLLFGHAEEYLHIDQDFCVPQRR